MRTFLRACFLLASVSGSAFSEPVPPEDYHVGSFGEESERLLIVCQEIANSQYSKTLAKHPVMEIEILKVLGADSYLVIVGDRMFQMSFGEKTTHPVGARLKRRFRPTSNLYQDTTPIGIIPPKPEKLTPRQIILALKRGESFTLEKGVKKRRCVACGGFGFKSSIDKIKCPECRGVGIFSDPRIIRVIW